MDRKEVGITEEAEKFLKILDLFGEFLLVCLLFIGTVIFVSGFRFLNLFDTIARLAFGGFVAAVISIRFIRQYRRWRLKRAIFRRLTE